MTPDPADFDFPQIPFTFEVKALNFDTGTIHVRYLPEDSRLIAVEYVIPILNTFDPADLANYVKRWAPFDKWHAQNVILQHGSAILPGA